MVKRFLSLTLLAVLQTVVMGLNAAGQILFANAKFWHIALTNVAEDYDKKFPPKQAPVAPGRVVVLRQVDENGDEMTQPGVNLKVVN